MHRMTRRSCWMVAAALAAALAGPAYAGEPLIEQPPIEGEGMPEALYLGDQPDHPIWVRLDRMVDEAGDLNAELIRESDRGFLERVLASTPEDKCVEQLGTIDERGTLPPFDAKVQGSSWIFRGRITGRAVGFSKGLPMTLLRVEPVETMKGAERPWAHYFMIPIAQLTLQGVCFSKTDDSYARLPKLGEEVVLLTAPYESDGRLLGSSSILLTVPEDILVVGASGKVSAPPLYQGEALFQARASLSSVTAAIKAILQAGRGVR